MPFHCIHMCFQKEKNICLFLIWSGPINQLIFTMTHAFGFKFKIYLPSSKAWRFSPIIFLKFYNFTFYVYVCNLFHGHFWKLSIDVQLLHDLFVEKVNFPPFNCLFSFLKKQFGIFGWIYFWVIYSIPLILCLSLHTNFTLSWSLSVSSWA